MDAAEIANKLLGVSVKLPTFWHQRAQTWFLQAEAQFALRQITGDDTKFYYVVSALDPDTSYRVEDLIKTPPITNKYQALKDRLLGTFGLSESERAHKILHFPEIGDDKPSVLLDRMMVLLDGHDPCFLFRQVFLERLPQDIQAVLAHQEFPDLRTLAKAADKIWESKTQAIQAFSSRQPVPAPRSNPPHRPVPAPRRYAKPSGTHKPAQEHPICQFHRRHGEKANECIPPCVFPRSGNANAGRQ